MSHFTFISAATLLADGCQWLKGYLDSHPQELEELKVCQNKVEPK